jgi:hypothetical protein
MSSENFGNERVEIRSITSFLTGALVGGAQLDIHIANNRAKTVISTEADKFLSFIAECCSPVH